jgi:transposase-like protein
MNSREYKIKRESAKKLYLKGETDIKALARIYGVADKTMRNWIKKGNWNDELDEIANLEDEIRIAVKKALIKALREYSRAPQDTALQSLVSLLRQYSKNIEPTRDFIEYMKKFLDWLIDFYLARNDEQTAMAIQREILGASGIVEYFRMRATSG